MTDAVILAGGRSTRFGEDDKAVARLAGRAMIRRVADRLTPVVDRIVVNCRADQVEAIEGAFADAPYPVVVAEDPEPDQGPVAGIATGLRAADSEYAFVVACDMPFVEPDLVSYLLQRARGHDAAVPRIGDGWYQTTHAVYRAEAMIDACDRALAAGERKVLAPLERLDHLVVGEEEIREHGSTESFENLNTREEFERAAERFE